jgi:hypothetical protein
MVFFYLGAKKDQREDALPRLYGHLLRLADDEDGWD